MVLDATEICKRYRDGDARPATLVEQCLQRCEQDTLRAFVTLNRSQALAAADESTRRLLAGEPVGLLDGIAYAAKGNIAVAGLPWTAGIAAYRQRYAKRNAAIIDWFTAQGAVLIGTCNLHEAAFGTTTDNPWFGRCENPRWPGLTPGGSSGGSAAAVAAGYVPLALGTDTMGSVRIPAACCGVYGFKPSHGTVSIEGVTPLSTKLDTVGLIAASLRDCVTYGAMMANLPQVEDCTTPTIGVLPERALVQCTSSVRGVYRRACQSLNEVGIACREINWPSHLSSLRRAGLIVVEREAYEVHEQRLTQAPEQFSAALTALLHYGRDLTDVKHDQCLQTIDELTTTLEGDLDNVDAVLTPVMPQPAHPVDIASPADFADFTAIANLTGRPALALPHVDDDGLPVGLQIMGHRGEDAAMLGMSVQLAQALTPETA